MSKKRRLNKLISKWIKSDLPDDRSSVLLLRVTSAKPSPKPPRRPFSLPLALGVVSTCSKVQRSSSGASNGRRVLSFGRRDSIRLGVKWERPGSRHVNCTNNNAEDDIHCASQADDKLVETGHYQNGQLGAKNSHQLSNIRFEISQPDIENQSPKFQATVIDTDQETNTNDIRKNISDRRLEFLGHESKSLFLVSRVKIVLSSTQKIPKPDIPLSDKTFGKFLGVGDGASLATMETSVDSIGACSIDMEGSRELSADWSEAGSTATLRGSRITTAERQHHHLPSYLSLACTVNGYSTTTNYDSVRLARSRDASPHRIDSSGSHLIMDHSHQGTYAITNNLLSPPNLVPLPTPNVNSKIMTDNALRTHHRQEFYSSSKTMTFLTKESHQYSSNIYNTKDNTDGCIQRKLVSYESKNISSLNDQSKCIIESSTVNKEYTNGKETKSVIQQRVERLYGPGALAQGFFVSRRQKSRLSESEESNKSLEMSKLNQTLPDKFSDEENIEPTSIKQSTSSPSLPVLRHLRPEFRAQLPLASPRKVAEVHMQKSITVPKLKDELVKVNGNLEEICEKNGELPVIKQNGSIIAQVPIKEESIEKDGHYFLRILEEQTSRLLAIADRVESEIETPNLTEEVIGKLRSAAGKAKLLVSQKMQQFKGLCVNNINQSGGEAFPTTNEDLQGFWDMVLLQVNQVDEIFEEISKLKDNNWKEDTETKVEIKCKSAPKQRKILLKVKPSAAAEEARKQREEQRRMMIEERRKAMKAAQQQPSQPSIEIFVPESS
ncbi:unnamed protein product [Ceutorhynchus assimilis]|uniref:Disks large-associated protein 1 n=1 Tax=Ceutorhynchus assimilis TaxID=467358 RepID=A0A9N9QDH6_9CUCU|nr:unnamed protein product [Ceutorhynchus assimilis]